MVTVIIPALNEEQTIGKVVKFCLSNELVDEVIVVDDKSTDETQRIASEAGAKVTISKKRGNEFAMKEGILESSNKLLIFLDGGMHPYPDNTIEHLVWPLLKDECDFVKCSFEIEEDRTVELVAKLLLSVFYPELSVFHQPTGRIMAGKKEFFDKVDFTYASVAEISILIDMFLMHARIKEINNGYTADKKNTKHNINGGKSAAIAMAIIQKTPHLNNCVINLEELGLLNIINRQMSTATSSKMNSTRKLFVFDIDQSLLLENFIDACAEQFVFDEELARLRSIEKDPAMLTKRIAQLLCGLSKGEMLKVAASIPIIEGATKVIEQLRSKDNVIAVVSSGYQFIADYIKIKLGADFAIANQLIFFEGKATGEVTIPSCFNYTPESRLNHLLYKTNELLSFTRKYNVKMENIIAMEGSKHALKMIEYAGTEITLCTDNKQLSTAADKPTDKLSFSKLSEMAIANQIVTPVNIYDFNRFLMQG